jgi:hypothetical protein
MKNLKLMMITLMMCLITVVSFGQMQVDSFYQNKNEHLIYSQVEVLDSMSQDEINIKVRNWGGTKFVNMKEVLVSETKEQLVFNYITESFFIKSLGMTNTYGWYIRMVVQMKDNKIKISVYDDGNSFHPGSYSGGVTVPSIPPRRNKFLVYFNKDGVCRKPYNGGLESVRVSCLKTTNGLIDSIKSNGVTETNNDW